MMDRRLEFARILEGLKNSKISIDEFESAYFGILEKKSGLLENEKKVIKEIFWQVWQLYDDFKDDYLPVNEGIVSELNRYICFLRSGAKCEWPRLRGISLLNLVTFGCYSQLRARRLQKNGNLEAWPFLTREEYLKEKEKHHCE